MHVALLAKRRFFTKIVTACTSRSSLFSIPLEPCVPPHARTVEKCTLIILRHTKVTTVPPLLAKYRITSPSSLKKLCNGHSTFPNPSSVTDAARSNLLFFSVFFLLCGIFKTFDYRQVPLANNKQVTLVVARDCNYG